jgi:hypothetical protein
VDTTEHGMLKGPSERTSRNEGEVRMLWMNPLRLRGPSRESFKMLQLEGQKCGGRWT